MLKRAVRAIRRMKELRAAALKRSNELKGMLLEEYKIRTFQSVSLKLFDMPHQPRRMRQAVKIWRSWRLQTKLRARLNDIRGDGLNVLHKTEEDLRLAMEAHGIATEDGQKRVTNVDRTLDALVDSAVCRGMSEEALKTLRSKARTVVVRAGERVGETVTREELTILVEGDVNLRGQVDSDVSVRGDGEAKSMVTLCSRPGTCLNSFMDILEHTPKSIAEAKRVEEGTPSATEQRPVGPGESPASDRVRVRLTFGAEKDWTNRDRMRVSARAGDRGCVLAVMSMADYHECAGAVVGIQGIALKLSVGFSALCKYLGMLGDMRALWVDTSMDTTAKVTNEPDSPLACEQVLEEFFGKKAAEAVDTRGVLKEMERAGHRPRSDSAENTPDKRGGFFGSRKPKKPAGEVKSPIASAIAISAKSFPAGATVMIRGTAPAALVIEHGSLEAIDGEAPGYSRSRPPLSGAAPRKSSAQPIFTANVGEVVGAHLLLTGQRSGLTFIAGPGGVCVATLPMSVIARLARSTPNILHNAAVKLARRVRCAPTSLVWDRCGTEMEMLEAGEALNLRDGGVHVVVTGCLREQLEDHAISRTNSANNLRMRRKLASGKSSSTYASAMPGCVISPGEATGEESALLGSSPQPQASPWKRRGAQPIPSKRFRARAVRDSQVLWISSAGLDTLAIGAPMAFVRLARGLGVREAQRSAALSDSSTVASSVPGVNQTIPSNAPKIVSVIPVTEGAAVHLDEFCHSLVFALKKICKVRTVDSACRLAELGQSAIGPLAQEATANWLSQLEAAYNVIILKGDPFPSPWCAQCARHSDTILLVANASDQAPAPSEGQALQDRLLHGQGADKLQRMLLAQRELVLLHQDADTTPKDTKSWLTAFSVQRHHHIAMNTPAGLVPSHAARLARSLRQLSVGLVMGGGGARGLAHVGVLAALEEEGVPIDAVGGTSIGAMVGGMYARDPSALLVRIMVTKFAKEMTSFWGRIMDFTIPVVSYFTGWGMNRALGLNLGESKIEDTWLPFFCCTLDLISCMPIVHRNGTLWRYIRASMALVGFLPPVCDTERSGERNMHVLVDGGYVNNLPTDVMRALGAHYVIAVDVAGEGLDDRTLVPWSDGISGMWLLLRSLLPRWLGGGHSIPTMADMQGQLPFVTDTFKHHTRLDDIDVYIRPRVSMYGILDFGKYTPIIRQGYEHGLRLARKWKSDNPDVALLLEQGSEIRKGLTRERERRMRKSNLPSVNNSRESLVSDSGEPLFDTIGEGNESGDDDDDALGLETHHEGVLSDVDDDVKTALTRTLSAMNAHPTWTPAPRRRSRPRTAL